MKDSRSVDYVLYKLQLDVYSALWLNVQLLKSKREAKVTMVRRQMER